MNGVPAFWNQYGLEVFRTCRTRGAVLCETSQGLKLLKEWTGSEKRIHLEYEVLSALEEETGLQTDCCMKNLEGNLISVGEDQGHYVLRQWFEGRECSTREVRRDLDGGGASGEAPSGAAEAGGGAHSGAEPGAAAELRGGREKTPLTGNTRNRKARFQEEQGVQARRGGAVCGGGAGRL